MKHLKNTTTSGFQTEDFRICAAEGCEEEGMFKAPKTSKNLREYQWFCLPHVQEYNKKWNYFADMPQDEIEDFMQDAITGHRPTWKREQILSGAPWGAHAMLEDELERFLRGAYQPRKKPINAKSQKERESLALMSLEEACDLPALKAAYRSLVKQFHPDLHQGSKRFEEKFKAITEAYYFLKELYSKTS